VPISAQTKLVLGMDAVEPQLSLLVTMLDAEMETFPVLSKLMVGLVHVAVGAVLSITVIVEEHVALLPEGSDTVTV
jgi:hypothetical protein